MHVLKLFLDVRVQKKKHGQYLIYEIEPVLIKIPRNISLHTQGTRITKKKVRESNSGRAYIYIRSSAFKAV